MIDTVIGINITVDYCRNCVPLGPKGDKGAQGVKGDKGQAASSGVKYVRWGKTSCPNGAQIVYKGTKKGMTLSFI